jgi:hypothetical protein
MLTPPQPQPIRRDNAFSVPKQPGEIYNCVVTTVMTDGRISVHVPDLGSDIGPIMPLNTDLSNKYKADDTVVGTFMTQAMNSFIIIGSTKSKNRSSILIFPTVFDRSLDIGANPSYSVFTYVAEMGYLEYWNGTEWVQFMGPKGDDGVNGTDAIYDTAQAVISSRVFG